MSWSSVARTTNRNKKNTPLTVKYNTDSSGLYYVCIPKKAGNENMNNHERDNMMDSKSTSNVIYLPKNWDGKWVDFEKHTQLQHHIQSLPFSIRCIIKFAQQRIGFNKTIKLDYDKIDKDLKYQYRKYNGNKDKLKKLYFHYNATYKPKPNEHYDPFNLMYFGKCLDKLTNHTLYQEMKNYSVVHYLATEIVFGRIVPNDPVLILMKLFIKNKIVDCADTIHYSIWDGVKFSIYDILIYKALQHKERNDVIQNINHFVDLIMCCVEQKNMKEQVAYAIVEVIRYVDQYESKLHQRLLSVGAAWNQFTYGPDENIKYNDTQIIEKLLFRGMVPFQFTDNIHKHSTINRYERQVTVFNPLQLNAKQTKEYLDGLFNECVININVLKTTDRFPKNQMALVAPLLILPHLNKAKKWMKQILINCMNTGFSIEIANIICDYLYVNYNMFYSKEIQNNVNVRTMLFFDHILHFEMDKQFVNNFYEIYNVDKGLLHYMVNNYLYTLTTPYKELKLINFDVTIALIQTYNHQTACLEDDKFPLKSYGIYHLLSMLLHNPLFNEFYESFISLLKYIKKDYKGLFDINYSFFENQKNDMSWDMMAVTYHEPTTLMTILLKKSQSLSSKQLAEMTVMKFILNEFKNECDVTNPCLVTSCFQYQNLELFKYLIINYNYPLEKICDILTKSM
eukprot:490051_1